ncbi:MAG: hypothetical protein R3E83_18635 [Burkholderiaceae bacterium]
MADERIDIFLARELTQVEQALDDHEFVELEVVTLGWLVDELLAGRLNRRQNPDRGCTGWSGSTPGAGRAGLLGRVVRQLGSLEATPRFGLIALPGPRRCV